MHLQYSMLANKTSSHSLAWDLGTGNGQAAIGVAGHYEKVIATDVSVAQLKLAMPHPRVHYLHTPLSLSDDDLIGLIGGEASVDLVTAAAAVHWFDLGRLYYVVNHVLKSSGVFSVWAYNKFTINHEVDVVVRRFCDTTMPYWHENVKKYPFECYRTLPFPFENVGLGSEGYPLRFDIPVKLSLEGLFGLFRSWSAVATTKERGVELLSENMVKELKDVWGESKLVQDVVFKGFMLAGKPVPNVDLLS